MSLVSVFWIYLAADLATFVYYDQIIWFFCLASEWVEVIAAPDAVYAILERW